MAIFNAIQERGLNRLLQQRLTMLDSAPAPALVPEIGAQLVLESDRPEWGRWKGEVPFSASVTVTALAAEYSAIWVAPSPGLVVVITKIKQYTTPSLGLGWRATAPTFTLPIGLTNGVARDNSAASNGTSVLGIQSGTTAALSAFLGNTTMDRLSIATASQGTINDPIIIWPTGPGLLVRDAVANQALTVLFTGYYRPLLPNELG